MVFILMFSCIQTLFLIFVLRNHENVCQSTSSPVHHLDLVSKKSDPRHSHSLPLLKKKQYLFTVYGAHGPDYEIIVCEHFIWCKKNLLKHSGVVAVQCL